MTEETTTGIELTINGKPVTLPRPMTITDYLKLRGHHDRMVVVELNGTIIRRPSFDATVIGAGDKVEIVHFVGGGAR